jgi:hypothetical protein
MTLYTLIYTKSKILTVKCTRLVRYKNKILIVKLEI